jgi:hypothetical protein
VLAHPQEAADADHHGGDLAVLVDNQFVDAAKLFIGSL